MLLRYDCEMVEFPCYFQILIDGRYPNATDSEGCALPTLVYLAREKRPQHPHNFKAGAMIALVSCMLSRPFPVVYYMIP